MTNAIRILVHIMHKEDCTMLKLVSLRPQKQWLESDFMTGFIKPWYILRTVHTTEN